MDLNSLASHPALTSFNEGVGRGFLLYFLPLTVLRKHVQKKIMRRALAIGLFCGTIRLIRHYVENKEGEIKNIISKSQKENGIIQVLRRLQAFAYKYPFYFAGGMGAIASIIADPSLIQSELIIIWIMVRAIRSVIPHIPFASTIAMCLASSQVLSTWMKQPAHLDGSYVKFLNGQAGLKASIVRKLRTTQMIRPCETFHPNEMCVPYLARFFKDGFVRALRVYAPLYVVFFLFSKSKNVVYLVQNLIRSSAFLAIYCTLAWGSCCTFHHIFPKTGMTRKNIFLYTWVAGISTLIERTNRRAELAAYVSTYAIDSLIKTAVSTGRVPRRLALLKPIILVLSVAVMVHNRKDQPWIFSHFMLGDTSPKRKEVPIEQV